MIDHSELGKAGYCSTYTHTFIPALHFSFPPLPSSFVPSPSLLPLLPPHRSSTPLFLSFILHTSLSLSTSPPRHHSLLLPAVAALNCSVFFILSIRTDKNKKKKIKKQQHFAFPHFFFFFLSVFLSKALGNGEMLSRDSFSSSSSFSVLCYLAAVVLCCNSGKGLHLLSEGFLCLLFTISSNIYSMLPCVHPSTILQ